MKKIITAIAFIALASTCTRAQNINWKYFEKETTGIVQLNVGYDYGFTAQIGYSRLIPFYRPLLLGIDFSLPMGSTLVDDFKVRIGSQIQVVESDGFAFSTRIASNFRRYQNDFVRSVGFGADLAGIAGYYSDTWHAAGEFGFDKAISTNLIHSDVMRSYYPDIKDGWYIPTGGHYYYGIEGAKTLSDRLDINLRIGETAAQFDDENAVLPYYLQLGVGMRF